MVGIPPIKMVIFMGDGANDIALSLLYQYYLVGGLNPSEKYESQLG